MEFMELNVNTILVNNVEYVRKNSVVNNKIATDTKGLPYVLIRTYSAGVHIGFLKRREGKEVELIKSRRVWYWAGAASLSQLAKDGTSKPNECKFPCEVDSIILTEAIEIIPCTEKAVEILRGIKEWKQ